MRKLCVLVAIAALCGWATGASALTVSDTGSVSFTSDLQPNDVITVDAFDTNLGTLNSVTIEINHSGSVAIRGDNDDAFNTADVQARLIRTFDIVGNGIGTSGSRTISSTTETLGLEDGDGGVFDATGPDGHDFGTLSYSNWDVGTFFPANGLYESVGPDTRDFTVDPTAMVNDLNWVGDAPDEWQLEVQDPILTVYLTVTYDYVPEPASLSLLAMGSLVMLRRRR